MTDKKISELDPAGALDGSEQSPIVQTIAGTPTTVRTTLSDIVALASSVSPGAPRYSVQFNNPLGTFAGDDQALWFPNSTPGDPGLLLLNSADALVTPPTAGSFTPGLINYGHTAVGNYADIDTAIFAPGDPAKEFSTGPLPTGIVFNEFFEGDLSAFYEVATLVSMPTYKDTTSGGFRYIYGIDVEPVYSSESTADVVYLIGQYLFPWNFADVDISFLAGGYFGMDSSAGNIDEVAGAYILNTVRGGTVNRYEGLFVNNGLIGSPVVTDLIDIYIAQQFSIGSATVTNCYGIYIHDRSGIGTAVSENIHSAGTDSLNVFEGSIELVEKTAPSGAANRARLFAQDNGSGKTQLAVIFPSGAVQVIATEP